MLQGLQLLLVFLARVHIVIRDDDREPVVFSTATSVLYLFQGGDRYIHVLKEGSVA